jgi:putative holliday junction resolvase
MRILGIDYGRRRMGLAVSDESGFLARPLDPHVRTGSLKKDLADLSHLAAELEAGAIVVGLPLNMDGSKGEMALEVEAFAQRLRETAGIEVFVWDERLTSEQAERTLLEADVRRRDRKRLRDGMAAALILQGFLDSRTQST